MAIVRWAACFFGFGVIGLIVAACGSNTTPAASTSAATPSTTNAVQIQGYLESDSDEVVFLNLTVDGSSSSGQMTTSKVDPAADTGVRGGTSKFSAKMAGSGITLDFGSVQWS